jgi:glutamate N-acetyltransferase/amino-acid N-acetyltransferase
MSLGKAEKVLKERDIHIILDLGEGSEKATAWGCDLTEEYVRINAEYN